MDTRELNGRYRGKVVDGGLGKTGGGKEQAALLCQLGGDGPEKGLQLTYYGSFSDASFEHTFKALRAAGWSGTDLAEIDDWKKAVPAPPECEFVIEQEPVVDQQTNAQVEVEGVPQTRARVRWINPVGRIGVKERLAPAEAQSFAQKMKGKLLAFDQQNKGPKTNGAAPSPAKPGARPSPPPPVNLDEPPF